jgi:hypothetical protein
VIGCIGVTKRSPVALLALSQGEATAGFHAILGYSCGETAIRNLLSLRQKDQIRIGMMM